MTVTLENAASRESLLQPSFEAAAILRETMQPDVLVVLDSGIARLMADNAKDYTGPGTNTYLIGRETLWLLDPGPACEAHAQSILRAVDGRPVSGIFVTHSHEDHSPGARLLKETLDCPVYGLGSLDPRFIGVTDEEIDPDFSPDVRLEDGAVLDSPLGKAVAVHTPGHFPNHLCLYFEESGALFTGDHVMGWSTTVVVPPLGHLRTYLASLEKLDHFKAACMYPSHGEPVTDPAGRVRELVAHRSSRHRQVQDAIAAGWTQPSEIVDQIYDRLPSRLRLAAEGQVQAHLDYMAETAGDDVLKRA